MSVERALKLLFLPSPFFHLNTAEDKFSFALGRVSEKIKINAPTRLSSLINEITINIECY